MTLLDPALLTSAVAGAAAALAALGAVGVFVSDNVGKRLVGAAVAMLGALLALAALHAPPLLLTAGVAAALAYAALYAVLLVRAQETYGDIEITAIDAADEQTERTGEAP